MNNYTQGFYAGYMNKQAFFNDNSTKSTSGERPTETPEYQTETETTNPVTGTDILTGAGVGGAAGMIGGGLAGGAAGANLGLNMLHEEKQAGNLADDKFLGKGSLFREFGVAGAGLGGAAGAAVGGAGGGSVGLLMTAYKDWQQTGEEDKITFRDYLKNAGLGALVGGGALGLAGASIGASIGTSLGIPGQILEYTGRTTMNPAPNPGLPRWNGF